MINRNEANERAPVLLWAALRVLTFITMILAYVYETGGWADKSLKILLTEPWFSYDTYYYFRIVAAGYQVGELTSIYHPLYPWLSTLVAAVVQSPIAGLVIVSSLAGLGLTIVFYRFARLDVDHTSAWTATALLLCWPASVAIFLPYTEALFLFLTVSCLLAARKRQFLLAGSLGALAALTRQQGVLIALPLLWELWEASEHKLQRFLLNWRTWVVGALPPAGFAFWILYRAIAISDVNPNFSSPQRFIYSVLVSPHAFRISSELEFLPPWVAVWRAFSAYSSGRIHWSAYGDAFLAAVFLSMLVLGWRYLRTSYKLYCLAVVLIAISFHTGVSANPYHALPRHLTLAFPVFLGMAQAYRFTRLWFILGVLLLCQMLVLCCYVWQTWVP
ncbi:MAG TPA: glycosyltransferase family 39 protein [Pyrinomonadaceae bacterium]|nr:glycosyltransferase family 39 protein [Pyrinomonadaceae bacterium]